MHRRIRLPLLALAATALCAVSCREKTAPVEVLAEVGTTRITADELRAEAQRRAGAGRAVPDKATLLQEMVHHAAMMQRARAAGIEQDPEYRRRIENLILAGVVERELTPRLEAIGVSEAEIQAEYDRELARFTHPEQMRLALLFLETGPKTSEAKRTEQRARLEDARRRWLEQSGETDRSRGARAFGALAIECSDEPVSRYRGGDIGWIQKGQPNARFPESVLETAWSLPVGQLSDILESPEGMYLVLKTDLREAKVTPLAAVHASLRQTVLVRKRKEVEDAFRQEVLSSASTRVNTTALATVELPVPQTLVARTETSAPPVLPGSTPASHGN